MRYGRIKIIDMDVDNPGPLAGVRVLDLTAVVMGPLATQILGDLGADVISVENRQGDINRVMSASPVRGLSGVALNLLRNKRNIAVDLGHPDGRAAQRIEIPMTDAVRSFVLTEHGGAAICEPPQGPAGYNRILTPLRGALQTADGWIAVQPHRETHWTALLEASGLPELVGLVGDPRLTSRGVWLNPAFAYATLGRVLAAKTTAEWLAFCSRHRIPAGRAASLDDLIAGLPQDRHPEAGNYRLIPPPTRFSATPASVRRPAPLPGQHTREVLAEAGLTDADITALEQAGVLRAAERPARG